MKFETLADVPAPIQQFYQEVTYQRPSGRTISESYDYVDENGDTQTGTRLVEEIEDYVVVEQIPATERKSWADVERVVGLGKPQHVINNHIACAQENDRQTFLEKYLVWLGKCVKVDEYNVARTPDPETGGLPEAKTYSTEPTLYVGTGKTYLVQKAKQERDTGREAAITVGERTFDADKTSYENMVGTVQAWDAMTTDPALIAAGLVADGKLYWTLADNTNVLITKAGLEAVISAIRVRAGLLHANYQAVKA